MKTSRAIVIALSVGLFAGVIIALQYRPPDFHTDFGVSWFGARSVLHGIDPYPLVGRGKTFDFGWPLIYPATSFVAILPLGFLTEKAAAILFIGASSSLLAFGIASAEKWYLFPLFITESFLNAARLGQWNILLTAILFFPALSFLSAVKPQAAIPLLIASPSRSVLKWAALGSLILVLLSIALIPSWISEWIPIARHLDDPRPAVLRFGGFLLLLSALKWRRPEARLLLALACVPQTSAWYSALPLFTIPKNLKESSALFAIATLGGYAGAVFVPDDLTKPELYAYVCGLQILTMYLPCLVMVLRRPNEGELPSWLRFRAVKSVGGHFNLSVEHK